MQQTPSPKRKKTMAESDCATEKRQHYQSLFERAAVESRVRKSIVLSKRSIDILRSKDLEINKLEKRLGELKRGYQSRERRLKDRKIVVGITRLKKSVAEGSIQSLRGKAEELIREEHQLKEQLAREEARREQLQQEQGSIRNIEQLNKELQGRLQELLANKPTVLRLLFQVGARQARELASFALVI